MDSYQQTRSAVLKHFLSLPEVRAVYEYGSVSVPGVSDLDLIVVCRGDLKQSKAKDFQFSGGLVPLGTVMVMHEQDFADIQWFDQVNLKLLGGEECLVRLPDAELIVQRERASIVDWLPERWGRLLDLYRRGVDDVSYALRLLRSFGYSYEKVGSPELIKSVVALRQQWRGGKPDRQRLVDLVQEAIEAGGRAINAFAKKSFDQEQPADGSLFLYQDMQFIFMNEEQLPSTAALLKTSDSINRVPLSNLYAGHFIWYSQQPGLLAEQMRRQMKFSQSVVPQNKDYRNFLSAKMALGTRCADFLVRNGFTNGLFRFGFYLSNYLRRVRM